MAELRTYRLTHKHGYGTDVHIFQSTSDLSKGYSEEVEKKVVEQLNIDFDKNEKDEDGFDESIEIEPMIDIPVINL